MIDFNIITLYSKQRGFYTYILVQFWSLRYKVEILFNKFLIIMLSIIYLEYQVIHLVTGLHIMKQIP